jgi:hypothetical protein
MRILLAGIETGIGNCDCGSHPLRQAQTKRESDQDDLPGVNPGVSK